MKKLDVTVTWHKTQTLKPHMIPKPIEFIRVYPRRSALSAVKTPSPFRGYAVAAQCQVASRSGDISSSSPIYSDPSWPGTTYEPMSHFPRSTSRQRGQQNGNDLCADTDVY